jgi:hypothetical protein
MFPQPFPTQALNALAPDGTIGVITSAKFKMLRTCTHTDVHRHTTTVRPEEKAKGLAKGTHPAINNVEDTSLLVGD